jgi:ribonuclease P protein component
VKPKPLDGKQIADDIVALFDKLQRPRPKREN